MAGATFSRLKVWVYEKLKAADLNAEFNNILTNLTPAGIDDLSVSAGEMQGTTAPFPSSVLSQATSLAGELQRIRYQLVAIMGTTYWYQAPASTVLAMAANISGIGQYILDSSTPTYIGGTSFSVLTDRTAEFTPGRRIQCVVTAGTLYGTVVSSSAGGGPTITTVVLLMDSGALDAGLSSFGLGMISPSNNNLPTLVPLVKTDDYTIAIVDNRNILVANKGSAISFTLGSYTLFPVGWSCRIRNIGAGTLTIVGTLEGVLTNFALLTGYELFIYNAGGAWRCAGAYVRGPLANTDNYIPQWDGTNTGLLSNGFAVGVAANNIPQMTGAGYYPAANGSLITSVTAANLKDATVGGLQIYIACAATERSTTSTSYTKKKETAALTRGGSVTIFFSINGFPDAATCGRIYKNGSAIGTEREVTELGAYQTFMENFTVAIGDVIQVYVKTYNASHAIYVKDLYVTANDPYAVGEAGGY